MFGYTICARIQGQEVKKGARDYGDDVKNTYVMVRANKPAPDPDPYEIGPRTRCRIYMVCDFRIHLDTGAHGYVRYRCRIRIDKSLCCFRTPPGHRLSNLFAANQLSRRECYYLFVYLLRTQ